MPIRDEVLNWLTESKADLRHAEASIGIGDYNWACFAAQQSVEKALKSLVMHILGEYPGDAILLSCIVELRISLIYILMK